MKQTGLVVGLCLACALSGAALVLAWDTRAHEPEELADKDAALARALEQLSAQLAALDERLEIQAARPSLAPAPHSEDAVTSAHKGASAAERRAHRETDGATGLPGQVTRDSPGAEALRAPERERLRDVGDWEDSGVRTRWLFVSQRGVLDELGVPDEVSGSDGTEYWSYFRGDEPDLMIQFHGGRLIRITP